MFQLALPSFGCQQGWDANFEPSQSLLTMPPKSDTGNQEESNVWSGNGPLSALTPREQTIMLQALLSDPNFPAVGVFHGILSRVYHSHNPIQSLW